MWKLLIRHENVGPPLALSSEHDTKEAALRDACLARKDVHLKILYIEGPNGEQIELPEIEAWCRDNYPA